MRRTKPPKRTHGNCAHYWPDPDALKGANGTKLHYGQCTCPVPPHFRQEYNTIFERDETDCSCFVPANSGATFKCHDCGKGTMTERIIPSYKTMIRKKTVVVRNAVMAICGTCGAYSVSAKELKRWGYT